MSIQPYAGGYLAIGTDGEIKNFNTRTAFSSYDDGYFNRFDGGLRLGCGLEYDMVYAELGFDFGLTNISKSDFESTHTRNLFINIGVNF